MIFNSYDKLMYDYNRQHRRQMEGKKSDKIVSSAEQPDPDFYRKPILSVSGHHNHSKYCSSKYSSEKEKTIHDDLSEQTQVFPNRQKFLRKQFESNVKEGKDRIKSVEEETQKVNNKYFSEMVKKDRNLRLSEAKTQKYEHEDQPTAVFKTLSEFSRQKITDRQRLNESENANGKATKEMLSPFDFFKKEESIKSYPAFEQQLPSQNKKLETIHITYLKKDAVSPLSLSLSTQENKSKQGLEYTKQNGKIWAIALILSGIIILLFQLLR